MQEPAEGQHAKRVTQLFSHIANVYDIMNRVFSLGLDAYWRKKLARSVAPLSCYPKPVVLDLAAGTLEVTVELAKRYPFAKYLCMDFCLPMLRKGAPKLTQFPLVAHQLAVADGRLLPLPTASVEVITLAFGLRNMQPRKAALQEAFRVLKPGGKLCILEFGSARDKIMLGIYNVYLAYILPFVGRLVSQNKEAYQHLADSISLFPSAKELAKEMTDAGFVFVEYERLTFGIVCLHVGRKQ